jgi:flagellar biogenesis protein FliO
MIQVIASFCIVLGLMFGVLFALRYFQHKQWFVKLGLNPKKLQIIESLPLDQKRRIISIRHETDTYLILLGITNDLVLNGPVPFVAHAANNEANGEQKLIEVSA